MKSRLVEIFFKAVVETSISFNTEEEFEEKLEQIIESFDDGEFDQVCYDKHFIIKEYTYE